MHRPQILLFLCFQVINSLNILIYHPLAFHSHITFMANVRDVLIEAGHNVTSIVPHHIPIAKDVGKHRGKEYKIPPNKETVRIFTELVQYGMPPLWTNDPESPIGLLPAAPYLANGFYHQCKDIINTPELFEKLKSEHFDVGITEQFDYCGLGILHIAGVRSTIIASSTVLFDYMGLHIGMPLEASFVPSYMGPVSDEDSSVLGRATNFISSLATNYFFKQISDKVHTAFSSEFGTSFPSFEDLMARSSLAITNSDPLIDFPRPTLHKIVDIGGISLRTKGNLSEAFSEVLSQRPYNIFISFGSVLPSETMPEKLRTSILNTIEKFPEVTFIWKYETQTTTFHENYPNLALSSWAPQRELLGDPRMSAFITHGGMGSVSEAMAAGIPMIVVPLFGDQTRNAHVVQRKNCGVKVPKSDLLKGGDLLEKAIQRVLSDKSIHESSRRIAEIMQSRPISPAQLLVKNVEFCGKFGNFSTFDTAGRRVGFLARSMIDVYILLIISLILIITISIVVSWYSVKLLLKTMPNLHLGYPFKSKQQ